MINICIYLQRRIKLNRISYFFITLFFGIFGVHKFINKQYGLGVLYMLTFGLFGVGWLTDSVSAFINIFRKSNTYSPNEKIKPLTKSDLLEWQKIIMPGTDRLVLSRQQLIQHSFNTVQQHALIADDCKKLIGSTTNIEVFFSRYDLLLEKLALINKLENYTQTKSYGYCLEDYIRNKQQYIINFIDRAWNKAILKADTLKTEKGKKNQFIKLIDAFDSYSEHMTDETVQYYKNKFVLRYPEETAKENSNDEIDILNDNFVFQVDDNN